ncbi:hypothetical protein UFOVP650_2 [uncultured Caudovirales phage]|uniref:Uncharacterized protein n=1 Tax=uncultured Caudovirales phage TaxID=2100421 RepID=A0A6J5NBP2_9CAUD|nr:hypothetical protein UFOVP650_2 [uncultured Caudovirales phage]
MSKVSESRVEAGTGPGAAAGESREPTPEEQIDATAWRVIRDVALIGLLRPAGRKPSQLTLEQQNDALEPLIPTLVGAHGMLRECIRQAVLLGVNRVHVSLHGQPGVDHEMLSEAVDFHGNLPAVVEDDSPFILE